MIEFKCEKCGHNYKIGDAYAGRKVRCQRCRGKIVLDVVFSYACGDFAPAALALAFSLGLITRELFG